MQEFLLVVGLGAHLLCVSLASAGPLVVIGFQCYSHRRSLAARIGCRLAWLSCAALLVGALLGLAVGLALWNPDYAAAVRRLEQRVFFGIIELVFSFALLVAYSAWWNRPPQRIGLRVVHGALALLAGTNLLYHFPFLFVVMSDLVSTDNAQGAAIDSAAFRSLLVERYVLVRVIHFALAAFVVTGVTIIGIAWHAAKVNADDIRGGIWGARIALVPGLLQVPVGLWMLGQMPAVAQQRVLGSDGLAVALLLVSVASALWLLHQLSALAMGEFSSGLIKRTLVLTTLLVIMMTGAARRAHHEEARAAMPRHAGETQSATFSNPSRLQSSVPMNILHGGSYTCRTTSSL